MNKVAEWGIEQDLIDLQARGVSGKPAARAVLPKIEAWARRSGQPVPTINAIGKVITRYFGQPVQDGRTRQARSQRAAEIAKDDYEEQIAQRRVDAIAVMERQVAWSERKLQQVDGILNAIEAMAKKRSGGFTLGDVRDAAAIFKAFSSELRGWLQLMVDVKDRLLAHQQYEEAFQEILAAIMTEAPDQAPAIANRLRSNPVVGNILRQRAVEGEPE